MLGEEGRAHQGGVDAHGRVLRGVAPDEGQEEDVEGEAERGEDGDGDDLERVVGQLPPVGPHCPKFSFFFPEEEEEEGDGNARPASPGLEPRSKKQHEIDRKSVV